MADNKVSSSRNALHIRRLDEDLTSLNAAPHDASGHMTPSAAEQRLLLIPLFVSADEGTCCCYAFAICLLKLPFFICRPVTFLSIVDFCSFCLCFGFISPMG